MRAAIIAVGNELLFGETVDTNAAWLGQVLSARGIRVVRRFTVGDVDADIKAALAAAMGSATLRGSASFFSPGPRISAASPEVARRAQADAGPVSPWSTKSRVSSQRS